MNNKVNTVEQEFTDHETNERVFQVWEEQDESNEDRMLLFAEYRSPYGTEILPEHRQAVRDKFFEDLEDLTVMGNCATMSIH